ncbi:hypothetical protein [Thiomicrorhabdus xiamenensis]|uniref:DUF302 domain-containing protein n=1 Tax=Thiomicrorhabdus xiamenensis TaxID=2739063 RepID=A0A7D4SMB8_9GAMM|nr:hypothetical protein [Thiomicrorhabdus xiamenensis]QKI88361.1 hypothetical protein HQN79_01610 [Thiomicrorhabdus xiamenensis]
MTSVRKFGYFMAAMALSLSSFSVAAQSVPATEFQDQFEESIALNAQTTWVLLSSDKASGKLVKDSLDALGLEDLEAKKGLYIADVSAMPSLITKMFALPKMKKYAFQMAVVNDESQLQAWPREAEKVSAIRLNALEITSVEYFDSAEALQAWIKQQF